MEFGQNEKYKAVEVSLITKKILHASNKPIIKNLMTIRLIDETV
jgi:hypothetical protein